MDIKNINLNNKFLIADSFGKMFICNDSSTSNKSIVFSNGFNFDLNISFKVLFINGHWKNNDASNMTLNNIPVVVNKYGTLIPIPNHNINGSTYSTLQPNTILDMYYTNNYDGNDNPAFVVIGNPVVLSSVDYTIYADGKVGDDVIGTIKPYYKNSKPYGWLICDGGNGSGSSTGSQTFDTAKYPDLYAYLGTNKVPDLRECTLVGAGTNQTFTITSHDVYNVGDFRDDQMESHNHYINHYHDKGTMKISGNVYNVFGSSNGSTAYNEGDFKGDGSFRTSARIAERMLDGGTDWGVRQRNIAFDTDNAGSWTGRTGVCIDHNGNTYEYSGTNSGRTWTTTHGKQIGVTYLIKAL